MGSIRTRKRGKKWEYSFEAAPINGKRKSISKGGFLTKADCLKAATQAKAEYDNAGRVFKPADISVSDYLDQWLDDYASQLKPRSYSNYKISVEAHIKPALGAYRLSALDTDIIQEWLNEERKKTSSMNTLKSMRTCLSSAMHYAVQLKYIKYNPCHDLILRPFGNTPEVRRMKEKNEYVIPRKDYNDLMEKLSGKPCVLPFEICYHLGTRLGECFGILTNNIDLDKGTVFIEYQMQKNGKDFYLMPPKYDSYRTIDIDPQISDLLRDQLHQQKLSRLKYAEYYMLTYMEPDGKVIQSPACMPLELPEVFPLCVYESGTIIRPDSMSYYVDMIHQKLGNPYFHIHCLRHTHGTILAQSGVSPRTIMERLGHKDIATTFNKYVFNTEKMRYDAMSAFQEYLAG